MVVFTKNWSVVAFSVGLKLVMHFNKYELCFEDCSTFTFCSAQAQIFCQFEENNHKTSSSIFKVVMVQNLKNHEINVDNFPANKIYTPNQKSIKCKKCVYVSSDGDNFRRHLKTHKEEKPHKCNQCDFASSQAGHLRMHLKTHSGEKPNKCYQCDFASSQAIGLRKTFDNA